MAEALAIVGAAVGFAVGGPQGAQIGFAIGSTAGSLLFPPKLPDGPRLEDKSIQVSTYGQPIPRIYGTTRLSGNVLWATELLETATEQDGKGGPTQTTFSYRASFAVSVCRGPIVRFRKIWADGRLIYNADGSPTSDFAAASIAFYLGTEDQLPDPTIQALKGATPAYRGQAYVVFTDLQLEKFGNRLPSLSFEVVQAGSVASVLVSSAQGVTQIDPATGAVLNVTDVPVEFLGLEVTFAAGKHWVADGDGGVRSFDATTLAFGPRIDVAPGDFPDFISSTSDVDGSHVYFGDIRTSGTARIWKISTATNAVVGVLSLTGFADTRDMTIAADGVTIFACLERLDGSGGIGRIRKSDMTLLGVTEIAAAGDGVVRAVVDGEFLLVSSGIRVYELSADGLTINGSFLPDAFLAPADMCRVGSDLFIGFVNFRRLFRYSVSGTTGFRTYTLLNNYLLPIGNRALDIHLGDDGTTLYLTGNFEINNGVYAFDTLTGASKSGYTIPFVGSSISNALRGSAASNNVLLSDVVTAESALVGLDSGDIDVSELTTTEVAGFTIAGTGAVRAGIEQLMMAYAFDAVESDGVVKFVRSGADPVVEIDEQDLAAHATGNDVPTPLPLTRAEEIEMPQRITIRYSNPDADYQVGAQSAQRLTGRAMAQSGADLPLVLTDTQARQIAETALYSAWAARTSTSFVTTHKHGGLEPTDVVQVGGNVLKITKRTENGGLINFDASFQIGSVYSQSALGASADIPLQVIPLRALTGLEFLDLPPLRDQDDDAGFYLAASGLTADVWQGTLIYKSVDGGGAYSEFLAITGASTIGTTSSVLGAWTGGNVFDETNSVTVSVRSGTLSSITTLAVLNGGNAALVGNEVLQFRTATLNGDGTYTLTGLLRGRLATPTSGHVSGERFVFLDPAKLRRAPPQISEIGQQRSYKPVTFGASLALATEQQFTNQAASLETLAPVALGGGRAADGAVLINWIRRTRIGGAWLDSVDVPLSEAVESYEVEIFTSNTFLTVARTIATSTPTASYTAAQQTTDFGSAQAVIYVKIYQLSATVGRGTALQGSL